MHTLMDVTTGLYLVTTETARYIIDLDLRVIVRSREHLDAAPLRHDRDVIDLLEVRDCTVGRRMVLRLNLRLAHADFTDRTSTPVQSIENMERPE